MNAQQAPLPVARQAARFGASHTASPIIQRNSGGSASAKAPSISSVITALPGVPNRARSSG